MRPDPIFCNPNATPNPAPTLPPTFGGAGDVDDRGAKRGRIGRRRALVRVGGGGIHDGQGAKRVGLLAVQDAGQEGAGGGGAGEGVDAGSARHDRPNSPPSPCPRNHSLPAAGAGAGLHLV